MIGSGKYALYAERDYPDGRKRRLRLVGHPVFDKHVEKLRARSLHQAAG